MDKPLEPAFSFSERAQQLTSSAIREILKVTERPEVISFAGGLPAPGGFPVEVVRAAFDKVLSTNGRAALQYGPTEGFAPLRQWVADDLNKAGASVAADQILIVSGSQQALDLLGKVLIDKDSKVLVEDPSYLGALQSFSLYQPNFVPVPTDEGGLIPEAITPELAEGARFLYALPNFQNPTGRTLSLERRIALVKRAAELNLTIVEDDPYGELRYAGEPQPGLIALAAEYGANVVRLGSFSKVLAPGLRLGYIVAPKAVYPKLLQAKQAADLHTPGYNQRLVAEVMKGGFLDRHVPTIRALYKQQCEAMLAALDKEMQGLGVHWNRPDGGMFLWVRLPEGMSAIELLPKAVERNVAFVPGAAFYADNADQRTLRLSFVTSTVEQIATGIAALAAAIREHKG